MPSAAPSSSTRYSVTASVRMVLSIVPARGAAPSPTPRAAGVEVGGDADGGARSAFHAAAWGPMAIGDPAATACRPGSG